MSVCRALSEQYGVDLSENEVLEVVLHALEVGRAYRNFADSEDLDDEHLLAVTSTLEGAARYLGLLPEESGGVLSREVMRQQMDLGDGKTVSGTIRMSLDDVIENAYTEVDGHDAFAYALSLALTGTRRLQEIEWTLSDRDDQDLHFFVTGDASALFE